MWTNPQLSADLVTFTEEILNRKLHFLCSATVSVLIMYWYSGKFLAHILFQQNRKDNIENVKIFQKCVPIYIISFLRKRLIYLSRFKIN